MKVLIDWLAGLGCCVHVLYHLASLAAPDLFLRESRASTRVRDPCLRPGWDREVVIVRWLACLGLGLARHVRGGSTLAGLAHDWSAVSSQQSAVSSQQSAVSQPVGSTSIRWGRTFFVALSCFVGVGCCFSRAFAVFEGLPLALLAGSGSPRRSSRTRPREAPTYAKVVGSQSVQVTSAPRACVSRSPRLDHACSRTGGNP